MFPEAVRSARTSSRFTQPQVTPPTAWPSGSLGPACSSPATTCPRSRSRCSARAARSTPTWTRWSAYVRWYRRPSTWCRATVPCSTPSGALRCWRRTSAYLSALRDAGAAPRSCRKDAVTKAQRDHPCGECSIVGCGLSVSASLRRTYQLTVISATTVPSALVISTSTGKRTRPSAVQLRLQLFAVLGEARRCGDLALGELLVGDLSRLGKRCDLAHDVQERAHECGA